MTKSTNALLAGLLLAGAVLLPATPASAAVLTPLYADPAGVGFNDAATGATRRAAFERALEIWSDILGGGTGGSIVVSAVFDTTGGSVLAFASSVSQHSGFSGSVPNRRYSVSLANQITQSDLNTGASAEINITFGDAISWYYNEFGVVPGSQIDFITVALHEIGHGLNFSSNMNNSTGAFGSGIPGIYDSFLIRNDGTITSYLNMTNGQRAAANISNQVYWAGDNVVEHYGGNAAIYAPNPIEIGSSISHWSTFLTNELMEPAVSSGVRLHDPGLALEALLDMGWELEAVASPAVGFPRGPSFTRQVTIDEGGAPAVIPVTLTRPGISTVTVDVSTLGAATPGVDYTLSPTTLTFTPGVKTQFITVTPLADGEAESQEIASLSLTNPSGGTTDLGFTGFTVRINNVVSSVTDWVLY